MKLKRLPRRSFNILFHTHTVTGLFISIGLFVIFLSGAFALFKEEMYRWENPAARHEPPARVDLDRALQEIEKNYPGFQSGDVMTIKVPTPEHPDFVFYGNILEADSKHHREAIHINTLDYSVADHEHATTHLGQTLYELHYFDQIPVAGLYLSGLMALFFVFASVTGVLIHWKNMIRRFYAFTVQGKWRLFWKDAHVTLSFLGLPFQLIYGVTGAFLGLSILLLVPSVVLLFDGSDKPIRGMIDPSFQVQVDPAAPLARKDQSLTRAFAKFVSRPDIPQIYHLRVQNYGKEDALLSFGVDDREQMTGDGIYVTRLSTGEIVKKYEPGNKTYGEAVYGILIKLHYGTFGGIVLKWIYFLLAMITCFTILSGIMLWQTSRDNDRYTVDQKRYHYFYTNLCLSVCLSLLPAIALLFLANKGVPMDLEQRVSLVNRIFFTGWLIFAVMGSFFVNFRSINRFYLLLTAVLSILIPIANGAVTGDWLWTTLYRGNWYVAGVDMFWLVCGILCYAAYRNKISLKGSQKALSAMKNKKDRPVMAGQSHENRMN